MVYSFTSKTLTPSLNQYGSTNWRAVWAKKKALQRTWAWDIRETMMPRYMPMELARARVTIVRHSIREMDPDNLRGGVKGLVDVMKPASKKNPYGMGLIVDDNPDALALDVRQVRVAKRADQRVVVMIEPWFPQEGVA